MPKPFTDAVVSAATCLEIPIDSLIVHQKSSAPQLPRFIRKLPSLIAYTLQSSRPNCTSPRVAAEFSTYPRLAQKFLKLVRTNVIILSLFFVRIFIPPMYTTLGDHGFEPLSDHSIIDLKPFLIDFQFIPPPGARSYKPPTTRSYRKLCTVSPVMTPSMPPPFTPKFFFPWSQFWKLSLSPSCRNIWYLFMHGKIPHKSLLHNISLSFFESPACPICSDPMETQDHFLFSCPSKLLVWQYI